MAPDELIRAIRGLLAQTGRQAAEFNVEPLSLGGNNRLFVLQSGDERFALKWYYHDPADPRDRLDAEFAFLEHAWRIGLQCIPRPFGCDRSNHLALYELIEGTKLDADKIDAGRVAEAARFFALLNSEQSRGQAAALPRASEACFSLTEHFRMLDGRIARLGTISAESAVNREAIRFACDLAMRSDRVKESIHHRFGKDEALAPAQRCLSPSDFGFHNALVRPDGSLCFIDFEYAGWDDPAKAVGDFFSHPGILVPRAHFEAFLSTATAPFQEPAAIAARARLLEPIFRLKWCCIVLNEFLPDSAKRRRFADPAADSEARKRRQLDKAIALFKSLDE